MVATIMHRGCFAFEVGQGIGKNRTARFPYLERHRFPLVRQGPGKGGGDLFLILAQYIDGEDAGGFKRLKAVSAPVQAEQDQRWIEGDGIEGVGGEPKRFAIGTERCDDRDAGGKTAEGAAEAASVKIHGSGAAL